MQNINSLKNAFVWMAMFFVGIFVSLTVAGCSKDDVTGHDNNGNATMSVKATKHDSVPEPVYRDSSWVTIDTTVINLWWEYLRNDTVIQKDSTKTNFGAKVTRKDDKLETNATRLNNLGITEGQVVESRDGKNNYVYRQEFKDLDGQTYNGVFTSGYATLKNLTNVHAKLKGFRFLGFRNIPQETPADMDTLVITRTGWAAVYEIEPGANLAGKQFELALDSVDHFRYIKKNAPKIIGHKSFMYKNLGIWKSTWTMGRYYYWDNNTVTGDSMQVTLNGSYETIELKDKVVSNLADYSHADGSLKFIERTAAKSDDARVKKFDNRYEKKEYAENGIENDKFHTLFAITVQDAVVEFCDTTWTLPADEVAMTTTRNIFADEASDKEGYTMVRFTDTESAKYADGKGENTVALKETCKLYMKVKDPELIDVIFSNASKKHTASPNKVKVTLKGKEKYDTGAESEDIDFGFEMDEIWEAVDTFYSKQTEYIYETTDTMRADGSIVKTAQTKTVNGGTWSFNKYEGYTFVPVKIDGKEFKVRWHFVVYEDFSFTYKKYSYDKFDAASYSYKAENDKLAQNTDLTTASLEVWNYTVDGIFTIEDATRTAEGTGRLDKALEEVVINEGWDKFTFATDAKEYEDRVEYFLKWIREYNTGKKTSQEVKVVLKRNAEGSAYTITVENPIREIGSQTESSSILARTETASDIVINYDWKTSVFELPNYFDGSIEKSDIATFVDPTNVKVTKKNSKGEDVTIELPSFEHELTSTVSELEKVSESDELVEYTYTRTWNWASTQCTSSVKSIGNINKVPDGGAEPDFDLEIGKIFATVSRPSNRNGNPITAYTYLLVSKDGTKCLPIGIYKDVVTEGQITDMHSTYNSACFVKDANEVVPTNCYSHNGLGMMIWADKDGNPVDAETHTWLQGNRFNDRGNDWINHTGKYAPRAEKVGNLVKVTFEGTNVSYTFKGWNVQ